MYRFRTTSNLTLNSLLNDEIYSCVPSCFNDPFDSCFSFNIDAIYKAAYEKNILKNIYIFSFFEEHKKKPSDVEITKAIELLKSNKKEVYELLEKHCSEALKFFRNHFLITCFSKQLFNTTLWAHYANSGKGFAIEYDDEEIKELVLNYRKSLKYNRKQFLLSKIEYRHSFEPNDELMIDILSSFADFLILKIDTPSFKRLRFEPSEKDLQSVFLNKTSNWAYEDEWRTIVPNTNLNDKYKMIGKIKPKAIYLGINIEQHDKYLICMYCKENNIPCFQMALNFSNGEMLLKANKI